MAELRPPGVPYGHYAMQDRPLYAVATAERAVRLRWWAERMGVDLFWPGAPVRGMLRRRVLVERTTLPCTPELRAWGNAVWARVARGGSMRWVDSEHAAVIE